jgi:hypothetical protein
MRRRHRRANAEAARRRSTSAVGGGEEAAALHRQLDLLEEWRGRASNANAPDEQVALGGTEYFRRPCGCPTEAPGERRAVELAGSVVAVTDRPQHRNELVIGLGTEDRPVAAQDTARFLACFAFFSPRFSFKVLPDFFDWCWRGDLSAICCSSSHR